MITLDCGTSSVGLSIRCGVRLFRVVSDHRPALSDGLKTVVDGRPVAHLPVVAWPVQTTRDGQSQNGGTRHNPFGALRCATPAVCRYGSSACHNGSE